MPEWVPSRRSPVHARRTQKAIGFDGSRTKGLRQSARRHAGDEVELKQTITSNEVPQSHDGVPVRRGVDVRDEPLVPNDGHRIIERVESEGLRPAVKLRVPRRAIETIGRVEEQSQCRNGSHPGDPYV